MIEVGHSVNTPDGPGTVISRGRMFDSAHLMIRIAATGAVQWYPLGEITLGCGPGSSIDTMNKDRGYSTLEAALIVEPRPSAVVLPFRRKPMGGKV